MARVVIEHTLPNYANELAGGLVELLPHRRRLEELGQCAIELEDGPESLPRLVFAAS